MKAYIRVWARPMGAEPKIFDSRERAEVKCEGPCETEDSEQPLCNPWCFPEVVEFETEFEARKWMKDHYPMCYEELVNDSHQWPGTERLFRF